MTSSDKRPLVRDKKRAQGRLAREGEGEGAVASGIAEQGGLDLPVVREESPRADAACAPGVDRDPSGEQAASSGFAPKLANLASFARKGGDASGSDIASAPSAPLPKAPLGEEPSDFFDLGDFDDAAPAKRGIRARAAKKGPHRESDRTRSKTEAPQASAGLPPALVDDAAPEFPESRRSTSRKATEREKAIVRGRKRKAAWVVAACIFLIAAIVSGLLFWNAYLRYDDAADMRGEWQVADGSMTVVIDDSTIKMPDALEYSYELDIWEKTISFAFDDLSGTGSYRFSSDRRGLVIEEGEDGAAGVVALIKVSDDEAAEPHRGPAAPAAEEQAPADGAPEAGDASSTEGEASDGAA